MHARSASSSQQLRAVIPRYHCRFPFYGVMVETRMAIGQVLHIQHYCVRDCEPSTLWRCLMCTHMEKTPSSIPVVPSLTNYAAPTRLPTWRSRWALREPSRQDSVRPFETNPSNPPLFSPSRSSSSSPVNLSW